MIVKDITPRKTNVTYPCYDVVSMVGGIVVGIAPFRQFLAPSKPAPRKFLCIHSEMVSLVLRCHLST